MRSHNSVFPMNFQFKCKLYDSPLMLFSEVHPLPVIGFTTFCSRVQRLARANNLCESTVTDALYLAVDQYKAIYAVRKTWVTLDNQRVALDAFFEQSPCPIKIAYSNFRSRAKSLENRQMLDKAALQDALAMKQPEWVSFYGGGRRNEFSYDGEEFPEQLGKVFHSIAAFLRQIGRYGDKQLVWSRMDSGWSLDLALAIPTVISSKSPGLVYKMVRESTKEVYVGLTVCGLPQRWAFHVRAARDGSPTKLACAIREDGEFGFTSNVLEANIHDVERLREREIFWVNELEALGPKGLNMLKAGGLGGPRGKRTVVNGVEYRSLNEASRCISRIGNVPEYVIRARIAKDAPIPERFRKHSQHPDAGSKLWRKWQALLRRYPNCVVESWAISYDTFKLDVAFNDHALHLVRINDTEPWGPANFQWLTQQQKVEKQHGKSIHCMGVEYPSLKSLAQAHGIGESTFKDRIRRQGLSIEDAVRRPLGLTSYKRQPTSSRG